MKILILDNDLGFLIWMANVLEPFGYQVVPANTVSYAVKLIRKWRLAIDLLLLNPCIEGAVEFTDTLRRRMGKHLKVVLLVSRQESVSDYPALRPDAVRTKPEARDVAAVHGRAKGDQPALQAEWVGFVQNILLGVIARSGAN